MPWISTRGGAPPVTFREALFTGLAPDGGLYMPARIDPMPAAVIDRLRGAAVADVGVAVGADHCHQRAGIDRAVEVMHRRVAVIAKGEIVETQRCRHCAQLPDIAQNTAAQITAITTPAAASRSTADSRRIDGEIDAGGWPSPG